MVFEYAPDCLHTIGPHSNRTLTTFCQQHCLIAYHHGITIRPDLLWPVSGLALVTTRNDRRRISGYPEKIRQPYHQRRLAGTSCRDIPYHNHRDIKVVYSENPVFICLAAHKYDKTEYPRQWDKKNCQCAPAVPQAFQLVHDQAGLFIKQKPERQFYTPYLISKNNICH